MNAAEMLAALLKGTEGPARTAIPDPFAEFVARKLSKRIEAQRVEVEQDNRSTTEIVAAEIAKATAPQSIPLNGAAVLRAALAGGPGTINSEVVSG